MAGPTFPVRVPDQAKSWFKYLVNARSYIDIGRLDDAIESYNTVIEKFRLPDKEALDVHLALGQVCALIICIVCVCAVNVSAFAHMCGGFV